MPGAGGGAAAAGVPGALAADCLVETDLRAEIEVERAVSEKERTGTTSSWPSCRSRIKGAKRTPNSAYVMRPGKPCRRIRTISRTPEYWSCRSTRPCSKP